MKRKVCLIGPATLAVSLPSKWVKAQGIKKGDEVDILQAENQLVVSTKATFGRQKATVDLSGLPVGIIGRTIGALYKAGYDEIEFLYKKATELAEIQKQLGRTCLGFELIHQTNKRIVIRSISRLEGQEFDVVLRRLFLSLLNMAEESLIALKQQDKERSKKVILLDDSINRYSDVCRRLINKGHNVGKRLPPTYFIAESLENLGDMYRDIHKFVAKKSCKLSTNAFNAHTEVNAFLRHFYEIFYKFSLVEMAEFLNKKRPLLADIEKALENCSHQETIVLIHLRNITTTLFDLNGPLLTEKI